MFENFQEQFGSMFGRLQSGMCKLTMNGNIAVKCSNGYKTYNVKKGTLTNVSNFCFNVDEMFFIIPTSKVVVGDIIIILTAFCMTLPFLKAFPNMETILP